MIESFHICDEACKCMEFIDNKLLQIYKTSPESEMEAYVVALAAALSNKFKNKSQKTVKKVLKEIEGTEKFTEKDLDKLIKGLESHLGVPLAATMIRDIKKISKKMYNLAKTDASKKLGLKGSLALPDKRTQKWLDEHYVWWISTFHKRNLSQHINAAVKNTVIEQGLPRREAAKVVKDHLTRVYGLGKGSDQPIPVPGVFTHKPDVYWGGLSNHAATTAKVFADIESMEYAEIQKYRIIAVVDRRTCPICLSMNQQEFAVSDGAATRQRILEADTPNKYKAVAGWKGVRGSLEIIDQGTKAMVNNGMALPPYHYLCRCSVVAL